jgi:hypothetical protein
VVANGFEFSVYDESPYVAEHQHGAADGAVPD